MKNVLFFIIVLLTCIQNGYSQSVEDVLGLDSVKISSFYKGSTYTILVKTTVPEHLSVWTADPDSVKVFFYDTTGVGADTVQATIQNVNTCFSTFYCLRVEIPFPETPPIDRWKVSVKTPVNDFERFYDYGLFDRPEVILDFEAGVDSLKISYPYNISSFIDEAVTMDFLQTDGATQQGFVSSWTSFGANFSNVLQINTTPYSFISTNIKNGTQVTVDIPDSLLYVDFNGGSAYYWNPGLENVPVKIINSPYFIKTVELNIPDSLLIVHFREQVVSTTDANTISLYHNGTLIHSLTNFNLTKVDNGQYGTRFSFQFPTLQTGLDQNLWTVAIDGATFTTDAANIQNNAINTGDNFKVHTRIATAQLDSVRITADSTYVNERIDFHWSEPVYYYTSNGVQIIAFDGVGTIMDSLPMGSHSINNGSGLVTSYWYQTGEADTVANWLAQGWIVEAFVGPGAFYDQADSVSIPKRTAPVILADNFFNVSSNPYSEYVDTNNVLYKEIFINSGLAPADQYTLTISSQNASVLNSAAAYFTWTGSSWLLVAPVGSVPGTSSNVTVFAESPLSELIVHSDLWVSLGNYPSDPYFLDFVSFGFDKATNRNALFFKSNQFMTPNDSINIMLKAYSDGWLNTKMDELQLTASNNFFENDSSKMLVMYLTDAQITQLNSWYTNGYFVHIPVADGAFTSIEVNELSPHYSNHLLEEVIDPNEFNVLGRTLIQFAISAPSETFVYDARMNNNNWSTTFQKISPSSTIVSTTINSSLSSSAEAVYDVTYDPLSSGDELIKLEGMYSSNGGPLYDTVEVYVDVYDPTDNAYHILLPPLDDTLTQNSTTSFPIKIESIYNLKGVSLLATGGIVIPTDSIIVDSLGNGEWSVIVTSGNSFGPEMVNLNLTHDVYGALANNIHAVEVAPPNPNVTISGYDTLMNYENDKFISITAGPEFALSIDWANTTVLSSFSASIDSSGSGAWLLHVEPSNNEWGDADIMISAYDMLGNHLSNTLVELTINEPVPPFENTFIVGSFDSILKQGDVRVIPITIDSNLTLSTVSQGQNVLQDYSIVPSLVSPGHWNISVTTTPGQWGETNILARTYTPSNVLFATHSISISIDSLGNATSDLGMASVPCTGVCINYGTFYYNLFNSKLEFEFTEVIRLEQPGDLIFQALKYDYHGDTNPDTIGEMKIPINTTTQISGNRIDLTLTESQKEELKRIDLLSEHLEVFVESGVFKGTSSNTLNMYHSAYMDIQPGPKFQLYSASYDPFNQSIELKFDGPIDTLAFSFYSVFRIGEGPSGTNAIDISLSNIFLGDLYCGECGDYVKTITVYLNEEESKAIESFVNKNNLIVNLPDGMLKTTSNVYLEESTFQEQIPLTYGVDYGKSWIEKAQFDYTSRQLQITFNQDIMQYSNVSMNTDIGISTVLYMFGVRDVAVAIDGPPAEESSNFVYLRDGVEIVNYTTTDSMMTIEIGSSNNVEVDSWVAQYGSMAEDELIIYVPYGAFLNNSNQKSPDMSFKVQLGDVITPEDTISTGDTTVGDTTVSDTTVGDTTVGDTTDIPVIPQFDYTAPEVDVKKFDGVAYFVLGTDEQVSVSNSASFTAPVVAQYETYGKGSRVYLEAGAYYHVVRVEDSLYSNEATISGDAYTALDLEVVLSEIAYRIQFLNNETDNINNATFQYIIENKALGIVDTIVDYAVSHVELFGFTGDTIRVRAALQSLEGADSLFIEKFAIDTVVVLNTIESITPLIENWQMVSFGSEPFDPTTLDETTALFWWDDNGVFDLLFDRYVAKEDLSSIQPGQGVWVTAEALEVVSLSFDTTVASVDLVAGDEGWNLVGNPYGFKLLSSAFGNVDLFKWDGNNYYQVNYLEPGEGYWATVSRSETIELERKVAWGAIAERASDFTFKTAAHSQSNWELGIALKGVNNDLEDSYNSIGVKPLAENSIDESDKRELPAAMGESITLSFVQEGKLFRGDYKSAIDEQGVWNVTMGTSSDMPMDALLSLQGLEDVRALGYSVYLVNGSNQIEITQPEQEVTLSGVQNYSLVVSEGALNSSLFTARASVTNFPNPLRTFTTIMLNKVENPGAFMHLRVFTVTGELLSDKRLPYAESIHWEPVDSKGAMLNSGMYFYEITTGATTVRNKMLIMD